MRRVPARICRLEKKAKDGDVLAITKLVEFYDAGVHVRRNKRRANEFLRLGAKIGDPYLTWVLADCLYHGEGMRTSKPAAVKLYQKAVKLGVTPALTNLGYHYLKIGTVAKKSKAILFYKRAAKLGEKNASYNLGLVYHFGDGLEENQKLAFKHFNSAAKFGHIDAQYYVGKCYFFGLGVRQSLKTAVRWLSKPALKQHSESAKLLDEAKKISLMLLKTQRVRQPDL
jgi:TPR repeat protein